MSKVIHIDEIGALISDLQSFYKEGDMDGLIVISLHKDGTYSVAVSQGVGFIRGLGLLEATKEHIFAMADTDSEI